MRDFVVWRRQNQREGRFRILSRQCVQQIVVTLAKCRVDLQCHGHVPAVIHAEHHRNHCRMKRGYVALDTLLHGPCIAAIGGIAGNARIDESDAQCGITGESKLFHEPCIKVQRGDAVPIEDYGISVLDCQILNGGALRVHMRARCGDHAQKDRV